MVEPELLQHNEKPEELNKNNVVLFISLERFLMFCWQLIMSAVVFKIVY